MTSLVACFVSTFSTTAVHSSIETVDFRSNKVSSIEHTSFVRCDSFRNYPMDEISASLASGDITIPSHLQTADEIDEWIMSL